jgi:hypothetical protein
MKKITIGSTYGYANFITEDERKLILNWIEKYNHQFTPNGSGRKFGIVYDFPEYPKLIKNLRERIVNLEQIKNYLEEPTFKDYVGYITDGGAIHMHSDKNIDNYTHTRYNVVISYPEKGGESIYGNETNVLFEKMVWKCIAGRVLHGSKPVIGQKPRITLSLGFLIHND